MSLEVLASHVGRLPACSDHRATVLVVANLKLKVNTSNDWHCTRTQQVLMVSLLDIPAALGGVLVGVVIAKIVPIPKMMPQRLEGVLGCGSGRGADS